MILNLVVVTANPILFRSGGDRFPRRSGRWRRNITSFFYGISWMSCDQPAIPKTSTCVPMLRSVFNEVNFNS